MSKNEKLFEEALLQKIENNEGYVYQILILAEDYGTSIGKVKAILKKYMKQGKITRRGYKIIIKEQGKEI